MSFRKAVFSKVRFDETLTGYCLGEDVDISLSAGRYGNLVVNPQARLIHRVSECERDDIRIRGEMQILNRHYIVRKHFHTPGHRLAFWWSALGQILITLLRVRNRYGLRLVSGNVRGAYMALRAPLPSEEVHFLLADEGGIGK